MARRVKLRAAVSLENHLTPEMATRMRQKIQSIVKQATHCISNCDFEDLCAAAFSAVVEAIPKFDITRGVALEYYLCQRARFAILDELRSWDILPRSMRFRISVLEKTEEKLAHQLKRDPTEQEIASEMEISMEQLERLREMSSLRNVSIDEPIGEDKEFTLSEIIGDSTQNYAWDIRSELHEWLRREVHGLKADQNRVIREYYWNDRNLSAISKLMCLTESRISQIKLEAIRVLGAKLLKSGLASGESANFAEFRLAA